MKWISDLIDLIFPRSCMVCGELLSPQEKDICLDCLGKLPKIEKIHLEEIEKSFWGKISIERATSFIYYHKSSPYNNIIHNLKYKNRPEAGERLAFLAATEIAKTGFFDGIDAIVPLPLSKKVREWVLVFFPSLTWLVLPLLTNPMTFFILGQVPKLQLLLPKHTQPNFL